MTTFTAEVAFDTASFVGSGSIGELFEFGEVVTMTATVFALEYSDGTTTELLTLTGSFANYVDGFPTTGTISGISYSLNGVGVFNFANVTMTVEQFTGFVQADSIAQLFQALLSGADQIQGSSGRDVLLGYDGNDSIDSGDGNDVVEGGNGDDVLHGGNGNDTLRGGLGSDQLYGGAGNDFLSEASGNNGPFGNDLYDGGEGNDRVSMFTEFGPGVTIDLRLETAQNTGSMGIDTFVGIEHITANYGNDTLIGNEAANWFWTFSGNDNLSGNGGNDYFTVGQGNKVADGGSGSDTIEVSDTAFQPLYTAAGITVSLALQGAAQATGIGNWTLTNMENLGGSWGNDRLTGDANANTLAGAQGDDTLVGGDGDDILAGDGTFDLDINAAPAFLANPNWNGGNDILDGGNGNDTLYGNGGADRLRGGAGSDVLDGGDGTDTAIYSGLFRSYQVERNGASGTVAGGAEGGTDTLTSIEVIEFQDGKFVFDADGVAAQVTRLYDTVLQRAPDLAGLDLWVDQLEDRGGTLKDVANGFLNSSEFQASTGSLSNPDYVEFLYQNALGRASDPGGKAGWVDQLNTGTADRADLLIGFSESQEHRNLTADLVAKGFFNTDDAYQAVALLYDSFAGRLPDAAGLVGWAEAIKSGAMTISQVADGFANSQEFQNRTAGMSHAQLVEFMYENTLDRGSDPAGKQGWVDALDAGMSDGDLLFGFSQSTEHFIMQTPHITNGIDYF